MWHMREIYRKLLAQFEMALELPVGALQKLDTPDALHHLKLLKYFPSGELPAADYIQQGVGAHQDESG